MHEFSLMRSVLATVESAGCDAGAKRVTSVRLVVGDMAEVVFESMEFAFEALSAETICEGAELSMQTVSPRSRCKECSMEFAHDRFHWLCPACGSQDTELLAGREMYIDSIEIEEE